MMLNIINDLSAMQLRQSSLSEYEKLMSQKSLRGMDHADSLKLIDRLSAISTGLRQPAGIKHAIRLSYELARRPMGEPDQAMLHYAIANAWEKLRQLRAGSDDDFKWDREEVARELHHIRTILAGPLLGALPDGMAGILHSNAAALLNHMGRISEAQEYWRAAIIHEPNPAMARAKRGYALTQYAHLLPKREQVELFLSAARADLSEAIEMGLPLESRELFEKRYTWTVARLGQRSNKQDGQEDLNNIKYIGGRDDVFRSWAASNRLYLNPANDISEGPEASFDALALPSHLKYTHTGDMFRLMHQAYETARMLAFEGANPPQAAYPEGESGSLALFKPGAHGETGDYTEHNNASYEMAELVLKRTAQTINSYLSLGHPDDDVTLQNVWYRNLNPKDGLRGEFANRPNWPMKGLYWLSRDVMGGQLNSIAGVSQPSSPAIQYESDTGRPHTPPTKSTTRTLAMLKTARQAQMYLNFSILKEEHSRLQSGIKSKSEV